MTAPAERGRLYGDASTPTRRDIGPCLWRGCYQHMRLHGRQDAALDADFLALACLDAREGEPWPEDENGLAVRRIETRYLRGPS